MRNHVTRRRLIKEWTKTERHGRLPHDFPAFLSYFLSSRSTDNTPSTDNTTPTTQMSDEDTRESEALVVADFTHDPPETLAVLETPGVDDDFSRAKKKPCLDDRDTDSPLDKDRDTMPGPEERSSRPGQ